ncbi:TonB-dependent receptor [Flagellimonas taeanensis]|uniref:TonB-dependent receptor n=1 Tax=Flavobacteriaceae TaxID=49546 RepID=UPI000E681D5A|nr:MULTISPECIES: carboxypeptidase-like regulatory domain-containing protein [Allomuricauda]MDC6385745.1 carboxypeptidase-like regulatory domain-containing protein [Muricauda sp. SK9]RIV50967.1 TonB-dependent receptor [Allomuricauda taeanensis]
MKFSLTVFLFFFGIHCYSQFQVSGRVLEYSEKGKIIPVANASVYWLSSTIGTTTDLDGNFNTPYQARIKQLVISSMGYRSDTIPVNRPNLGNIVLYPNVVLDEVVVEKEVAPIQKSLFKVQNVVAVDSREMLKAACCNLSESFETNPTVDVNVSDAILGAKQIQMLGLNSPYLMFTQENMPSIRGASQVFGLSFTPGSWIESIQITKGAGSVLNGFESISGHINTELMKPLTDKRFFLNMYANNYERYEFNSRFNHTITDELGVGLYIHANLRNGYVDDNGDSFLDTPLANQINLMNRWQYLDPDSGWVAYANIQYLSDGKEMGQTDFDPDTDKLTTNAWGSEINTSRLDLSAKLGYVFPDLPYQSFGFQTAYSTHDQDSYYGLNQYDINHESFYSNLIFNSIIGSTQHKFKTGLSFTHDTFSEMVNATDYERSDNSAGVFLEYTFDNLEGLGFEAGLRADHHNNLGNFLTPRFHLRYSLWDKATFRASFGRGKRGANIFAENQQFFASARQIRIDGSGGNYYGLNPEKAWNYGVSFIQKLYVWNRVLDFSIDFYRTQFEDQIVVDWENPREIAFYNLNGKSYSNSLQVDLNYEVLQDFHLRSTYKFFDVATDYNSGTLDKPLQPSYRFFANLSYETPKIREGAQWRFDFTANWLGRMRLPNTSANPEEFQLPSHSPSYMLINAQVTKVFSNKFECYIGGENIGNFTQDSPILSSNDPFGTYFDSTILYGPVLRSTYYAGFRYKI